MRLYSFTNYYLSSIQQGIQPAHCIAEMFVKYQKASDQRTALFEWATTHRTMICLNGGNSGQLDDLSAEIVPLTQELGLPFASFYEDQQSLNGAHTSLAIVIPASIYEMAAMWRINKSAFDTPVRSDAEQALATLLTKYRLAK